jgi:hypothetical protein
MTPTTRRGACQSDLAHTEGTPCCWRRSGRAEVARSRVELFEAIGRDDRVERLSVRALADKYGVHRRTVREALENAVPPEPKTPVRVAPKLDPSKGLIDARLMLDLTAPRRQRHTAGRSLARVVDEHELIDQDPPIDRHPRVPHPLPRKGRCVRRSASSRTSRPRVRVDNAGSAASRIRAYRNSPTSRPDPAERPCRVSCPAAPAIRPLSLGDHVVICQARRLSAPLAAAQGQLMLATTPEPSAGPQQPTAAGRSGELPARARLEQPGRRGRRQTQHVQRIGEHRASRSDRPGVRVQRVQQPGEQHPHVLRPAREPAQPAPAPCSPGGTAGH